MPTCRSSEKPTRPSCSGAPLPPSRIGNTERDSAGGQGNRRGGDPPRLRVSLRECLRSPGRCRERRPDLGRTGPGGRSRPMGDKIAPQSHGRTPGVPVAPGHPRTDRRSGAEVLAHRRRADRLPGDDQGSGRRRWDGDERRQRRGAGRQRSSNGSRAFRAARTFGDSAVLMERFLPVARHVEVQILGAGRRPRCRAGRTGLLGAATQPEGGRGNPFPGIDSRAPPAEMLQAAVRAGEAVGYRNAGTVECLVDPAAPRPLCSWK